MPFCMQYHNYENEGGLPLPGDDDYDPFVNDLPSIRTSRSFVQQHIGSTVFLILGIGKNPRRFYLWDCFTIESVEANGDVFIASGPGFMLNPPQQLDGEDFHEFKEQCARFVSFKDISHLPYTATLRRLADAFHRPTVIDDQTRRYCAELRELIPDDPDAEYLQAWVDGALGDESSVELTFESDDEAADDTEPIPDEAEEIERITRLIIARRGQPAFRSALMRAYGGRCAVTGWSAEPALEAAHIQPYSGPRSSVVSNGLLLRSDIHTLFDLGLVRIHPDTLRIAIDPDLHGTEYQQYDGRPLSIPEAAEDRPDRDCLRYRREQLDSGPPI